MLAGYAAAKVTRDWLTGIDAAIGMANTAMSVAAAGAVAGFVAIPAAASIFGQAMRIDQQMRANQQELEAQQNAFWASYERRKDEWTLQRALADSDVDI